ncbi:hypothetical protein KKC22_01305, partial [Myxococcota bacterium]|nr:hypothetical protein [Myxococcota bacterium]
NPGKNHNEIFFKMCLFPSCVAAHTSCRGGGNNGAVHVAGLAGKVGPGEKYPTWKDAVAAYKRAEMAVRTALSAHLDAVMDDMSDPAKCLIISFDPLAHFKWEAPAMELPEETPVVKKKPTSIIKRAHAILDEAEPGKTFNERTKAGMLVGGAGLSDDDPAMKKLNKKVREKSSDPDDAERDFKKAIEAGRKKPIKKKRPDENELGEDLAERCCAEYEGRLVVEYAPIKKNEDTPWREIDPVNGVSKEITSTRKHATAQGLNGGEKLSSTAFSSFTWYVGTDPRMHREDLQTPPLVIAHKGGRFHYGLGRNLTQDEPGIAEIFVPRTILPFDGLLPFESTDLWQDFKLWGHPSIHLECRAGRTGLPRKSMTISVNNDGGGGGKTALCSAEELLVGPENTVHFSPDDLRGDARARTLQSFKGKLLGICDDCGPRALMGIAPTLKELAGADRLSGRALYRRPETFWNNLQVEMNFNQAFIRDDYTPGMVDRMDERIFTNRIRATSQERADVIERWAAMSDDLDVWFTWGVIRALEYLKTGRWADARSPREKAVIADTIRTRECRFLWERFRADPASFTTWEEIEKEYRRWWKDYDHRGECHHGRFLAAAALSYKHVVERQVQVAGVRRRGVLGVVISIEERDEAEDLDVITGLNGGQSTECTENPTKVPPPLFRSLIETSNKIEEIEDNEIVYPPSNVGFPVHSNNSPLGQLQTHVPVEGRDLEF